MAVDFYVSRSIGFPRIFGGRRRTRVFAALAAHFGCGGLESLVIAERQFPVRVRPDLQRAVESIFGEAGEVVRFFGIHQQFEIEPLTIAGLITAGWMNSPVVSPPQYEEVDIGEERPVRCLKSGLWLLERQGGRYAVLMSPAGRHGMASF